MTVPRPLSHPPTALGFGPRASPPHGGDILLPGLLRTHDGRGGCAARLFQSMTNTAAALRVTFNARQTPLRGSLGWATDRPRGCPRHACRHACMPACRHACMPAGRRHGCRHACRHACRPAGMPASMPACLQACFRHARRHACGLRRHAPAGMRFASPGQQKWKNA